VDELKIEVLIFLLFVLVYLMLNFYLLSYKKKYNLIVAIHATGYLNKYNIYIPKKKFLPLILIAQQYMHPIFLYKLNMVKPNIS